MVKNLIEDDIPDVDKIKSTIPKGLINPYGNFTKFWNITMIILLIYTGIVLPPRLAFD